MTNTINTLFTELSIIEEDFNKLDKNEIEKKLEKQLDKFMEEVPKLYNKVYIMYQEETNKKEFLESIQKFKETNEISGIIEFFFRLNTISIYTFKKSMESIEEDSDFNDKSNEFDNKTKKIFYNVLNITEEFQNLIISMKTSTHKSQTNILDKQLEETLVYWNVLYKRINECESTLNDAYTSFVDTFVESVDTIISSVEARLINFKEYMNTKFPKTIIGLSEKEKSKYGEISFDILMKIAKDFEGVNVSKLELQEDEKNWLTNLINIFLETNEDDIEDSDDEEEDYKNIIIKMRNLKSSIQMNILEEVLNFFRNIGKENDESNKIYPKQEQENERILQELRTGRVTSSYVLGVSKEGQMNTLLKEKNFKGQLVFQSYNDAEKFYTDTIFRYQIKKYYVDGVPKESLITQLMNHHNLSEQEAEQEYEKIINEYFDEKKRYTEMTQCSNL